MSGEGFYAHDTRYLSEIGLEVGGERPVALSYAAIDDQAVVDATNAPASAGLREPIPQLSLSVTRELMIASGRLYYLVRLRNFLREPVTTTASLAVASDFADMFVVRGGVRRSARGHALAAELSTEDPHHAYRVLRAFLYALRDQLTVDEAAKLAAQLPIFVRGVSFEGLGPQPET